MVKKSLRILAILLLAVTCSASAALADKCKDPIVDEVGVFSAADAARIEAAMNKLVLLGADPRVQILSSYHRNSDGQMNKSLAEYKAGFQKSCKSWQAPDGGLKNNIVLILVVPKKIDTMLWYGQQWQRFLGNAKADASTDMNARFRDGKMADGIVIGLEDVADMISVKPSQANKPVVINHPADYSGLWSFMKWMLLVGIFGGIVIVVFVVYRRKGEIRDVQLAAQTERGFCTTAMNGYTTPLAVLGAKIAAAEVSPEWKTYLGDLLSLVTQAYTQATTAFNALTRTNDPSIAGLSIEEYQNMSSRYQAVHSRFEQAEGKLARAHDALRKALAGDPLVKFAEEKPVTSSSPQTAKPPARPVGDAARERASSASRPSEPKAGFGSDRPSTTAHHTHRDDSTVIIIDRETDRPRYDDPLWRRQRTEEPDRPVIVDQDEPRGERQSPSPGDGIETKWGNSGDGDGVVTSWGKSGDGDGATTSWNKPDDESVSPTSTGWETGRGTTY